MKKFLSLLLLLAFSVTPLYAEDNWAKAQPAGSANASDIDSLISVNNNALDRLLIGYRKGMGVNYGSASTLSVLTGEIAIPNSDGSVVRYRRLTSTNTPGWAQIDTGVEATSTTYYLYALADTASTEPTFAISTSSSAPSGKTYYTKIAQFYNNASGDIENVINYRNDNGTDYHDVLKGWAVITMSGGTPTLVTSHNVSSITDNGQGDLTINWSTSFANANYAASAIVQGNGTSAINFASIPSGTSPTSSALRLNIIVSSGVSDDWSRLTVLAAGDRI